LIGVKHAGNVWHAGNKRHLTEVSGTKTEIFKIGINRVLFQGTVFKSRPFHGRFFIALNFSCLQNTKNSRPRNGKVFLKKKALRAMRPKSPFAASHWILNDNCQNDNCQNTMECNL